MARVSKKRIAQTIETARANFGLELSEDRARKIIAWDDGGMFVAEMDDSGQLDTSPRDYFGMALIDVLMPDSPTFRDDLIRRTLTRWHFPLNGSSAEYRKAFAKAWRAATKGLRVKHGRH